MQTTSPAELTSIARALESVWVCPRCSKGGLSVASSGDSLECPSCGIRHPVSGSIVKVEGLPEGSGLAEDHSLIRSSYDKIWEFSGDAWQAENLSGERESLEWASGLARAPKVVLDAGCGAGRHVDAFLKMLDRSSSRGLLILVEVSSVLNEAVRRVRQLNPAHDVVFLQVGIEAMPVRSGAADVVWSTGVLSVIKDQHRALKEMLRTCRGLLVLGMPTEKSLGGKVYLFAEPIRALSRVFGPGFALFLSNVAALSAFALFRFMRLFSRFFSPTTREMIRATLAHPQGSRRLQASFFDVFGAPRIRKKSDRFYLDVAREEGFEELSRQRNSSVEYFAFTKGERT